MCCFKPLGLYKPDTDIKIDGKLNDYVTWRDLDKFFFYSLYVNPPGGALSTLWKPHSSPTKPLAMSLSSSSLQAQKIIPLQKGSREAYEVVVLVISLAPSVRNAQRPLAKIGNKEGGGREETDLKLESKGHADGDSGPKVSK